MANTSKRLGPLTNTGTGGGSSSTGFVQTFNNAAWLVDGADYQITVNEAQHLKGIAPIVAVYELDGTYASVHVSIEVTNAGQVVIRVPQSPDNRFSGKLIIS
jgi:hypothetical protein